LFHLPEPPHRAVTRGRKRLSEVLGGDFMKNARAVLGPGNAYLVADVWGVVIEFGYVNWRHVVPIRNASRGGVRQSCRFFAPEYRRHEIFCCTPGRNKPWCFIVFEKGFRIEKVGAATENGPLWPFVSSSGLVDVRD